MGASSVTGSGHGASDNHSPQNNIKQERLVAPFGPRILICDRGRMSGSETTITHNEIADYEDTLVFVNSLTSNPVRWVAHNATSIVFQGTDGDEFIYMRVTMGLRPEY